MQCRKSPGIAGFSKLSYYCKLGARPEARKEGCTLASHMELELYSGISACIGLVVDTPDKDCL